MANWSNLTPENSNEKDDEFIILHQGINRLQKRDVVAASMSNARWIADGNYLVGSEVKGSDNLWYTAVVNTGSGYGNSVNPVTRTDDTVWKYKYDQDFAWLSIPIGSPFPLIGDLPSTDSDAFRYVVLTDADPYNDGVLINKEVSGTAPNLVIKYTIDMPDSPLDGVKIEMLNTMEAVISPSTTNSKVFNDTIRNITASIVTVFGPSAQGAFSTVTSGTGAALSGSANLFGTLNFNASSVVPTGARNQTFAIGAKYLMRIK